MIEPPQVFFSNSNISNHISPFQLRLVLQAIGTTAFHFE